MVHPARLGYGLPPMAVAPPPMTSITAVTPLPPPHMQMAHPCTSNPAPWEHKRPLEIIQEHEEHASQKKHMHNLINRRRTSRINELINALADKVPQLHEPAAVSLPTAAKDASAKAALL